MFTLRRARSRQIKSTTKKVKGFKSVTEYYYDERNRLSCVRSDGEITELYEYDSAGRRVRATVHMDKIPNRIECGYNSMNQLVRAGGVSFKYDSEGLMTEKIVERDGNVLNTRYIYHDRHLTGVILPYGLRIDYALNEKGVRIGKIVNGNLVEKYYWEGLTELRAVESENGLVEFTYGKKNKPVLVNYNDTQYELHVDQVGTPFALTDSTGELVKQYNYNTFGVVTEKDDEHSRSIIFKNIMPLCSVPDIPIGLAGGLYDSDTELVHFGMREYFPEIGRFTSPDPMAAPETAADVYGYCSDDPVNVTDKTGLWAQSENGENQGPYIWDYSKILNKNIEKAKGKELPPYRTVPLDDKTSIY